MKTSITFFSFALSSFIIQGQSLQPSDAKLKEVRAEIIQLVANKKIPSMAVAVSKGDQVLWLEAFGYADIESAKAATTQSLYPLGSVSKSITATLIMNLVEQRKLNLMSDVQPLIKPLKLTDVNGKSPSVPLWNLLNMTAGLAHGYSAFDFNTLPKTKLQKSDFLKTQAILAFEPGSVYEYSNHSYSILEHLIENTSGLAIQEYSPKVLAGLGMTVTLPLFQEGHSKIVSTYDEKLERLTPSFAYPGGGQGYYSSVEDLLNYGMFQLGIKKNEAFISESNLKVMHTFRQGPGDLFGLGWFNNSHVLVSNGNVTGGNARITLDTKEKIVIVCLRNRTSWDGIADNIASKIHEVFVPKDCEKGYETWRRIYESSYSPRFELTGQWRGTIKDPRNGKSMDIKAEFAENGNISFTMDGKTADLRSPAYNLFNELTGSLRISTTLDKSATSYDVKLKFDNGILTGYASTNIAYTGYGVKQPYYLFLKKEP